MIHFTDHPYGANQTKIRQASRLSYEGGKRKFQKNQKSV